MRNNITILQFKCEVIVFLFRNRMCGSEAMLRFPLHLNSAQKTACAPMCQLKLVVCEKYLMKCSCRKVNNGWLADCDNCINIWTINSNFGLMMVVHCVLHYATLPDFYLLLVHLIFGCLDDCNGLFAGLYKSPPAATANSEHCCTSLQFSKGFQPVFMF